jgi:hypothetical protein
MPRREQSSPLRARFARCDAVDGFCSWIGGWDERSPAAEPFTSARLAHRQAQARKPEHLSAGRGQVLGPTGQRMVLGWWAFLESHSTRSDLVVSDPPRRLKGPAGVDAWVNGDLRRVRPAPLLDVTRLRQTGALTRPHSTGLDSYPAVRSHRARTAVAGGGNRAGESPANRFFWRWSVRDSNPRPPTCKPIR